MAELGKQTDLEYEIKERKTKVIKTNTWQGSVAKGSYQKTVSILETASHHSGLTRTRHSTRWAEGKSQKAPEVYKQLSENTEVQRASAAYQTQLLATTKPGLQPWSSPR